MIAFKAFISKREKAKSQDPFLDLNFNSMTAVNGS